MRRQQQTRLQDPLDIAHHRSRRQPASASHPTLPPASGTPPTLWTTSPDSGAIPALTAGQIREPTRSRAGHARKDRMKRPVSPMPTAAVGITPTAAPTPQHCLPASSRGLLEPGAVQAVSFATLMGPPGCHELVTTSGGLPVVA